MTTTREHDKQELEAFYGPLTGKVVMAYLDGPSQPRNWDTYVLSRQVGAVISMSHPGKHGLRMARWDACFHDEVEDAIIYAIEECGNARKRQSLRSMLKVVMLAGVAAKV